jgi:peptidoglycan hydrolase-like protein with peptidoglycan-binding domain
MGAQSDELVLSPMMMRQLQHNLVDGGYLPRHDVDGRLTPRTRRALAEFQDEYHLRRTGKLDRATAEALLGHDTVGAYTLASAKR